MIAIVEIVSLIALAISLNIGLFCSSLLVTFHAAFFFQAAGKTRNPTYLIDENGLYFFSKEKTKEGPLTDERMEN